MTYQSLTLQTLVTIEKMYSIHYFEYASNFVFDGEEHDFWEFVYVDNGEITVITNECETMLKKGQMIFHKPNEFHGLRSSPGIAPNLIVMSFECLSPALKCLSNGIMTIGKEESRLLSTILTEAKNAFSTSLDDPYTLQIERADLHAPDSEQLIRNCLENLLILLIRQYSKNEICPTPPPLHFAFHPKEKIVHYRIL